MTNREFLRLWGKKDAAKDSIRSALEAILKQTDGPLTEYELAFMQGIIGHYANKHAPNA